MSTEKILEKLRKLMNLKRSADELGNVGEASAAAAGINRLLIEYNLSEEDIPTEEREKNPIIIKDIHAMPDCITIGVGKWYERLLNLIAKYNMCKLIRTTSGQKVKHYSIVGRQKNVKVVEYMESFIVNNVYQIARREYKEFKRTCIQSGVNPEPQASYIRSFMNGACTGLHLKFQDMKREVEWSGYDVTGLVVQRKREVDDFIHTTFNNLKTRTLSADKITSTGYHKGVETGKNFKIHEGVDVKTTESKQLQ